MIPTLTHSPQHFAVSILELSTLLTDAYQKLHQASLLEVLEDPVEQEKFYKYSVIGMTTSITRSEEVCYHFTIKDADDYTEDVVIDIHNGVAWCNRHNQVVQLDDAWLMAQSNDPYEEDHVICPSCENDDIERSECSVCNGDGYIDRDYFEHLTQMQQDIYEPEVECRDWVCGHTGLATVLTTHKDGKATIDQCPECLSFTDDLDFAENHLARK